MLTIAIFLFSGVKFQVPEILDMPENLTAAGFKLNSNNFF